LKSLTIEERGGGKISGLRYDSMDPLGHKLAEFPFQIGAAQPLSVMLEQLTLMLDGGELRTLDLSAATNIHFTDPQLQQQFRDYLAALAASRSKEKRSVF